MGVWGLVVIIVVGLVLLGAIVAQLVGSSPARPTPPRTGPYDPDHPGRSGGMR